MSAIHSSFSSVPVSKVAFLLFCLQQNQKRSEIIATPTTPPTIPATMGVVDGPLLKACTGDVGVVGKGVAAAVGTSAPLKPDGLNILLEAEGAVEESWADVCCDDIEETAEGGVEARADELGLEVGWRIDKVIVVVTESDEERKGIASGHIELQGSTEQQPIKPPPLQT
jgi:hypothetical protein